MSIDTLLGRSPVTYNGSKWLYRRELDKILPDLDTYDTIVDVFGGACWITHYLSRATQHPRLIVNDYDDFIPFITSDELCREYNLSALACYAAMIRAADGNAVPLSTHFGRNMKGEWVRKDVVDFVIGTCLSQPKRCMSNSLRLLFAFNSVPNPNSVWYMRGSSPSVRAIPDYIGRAERICCDARDIRLDTLCAGGKTLVICDPPYSTGGVNRWYNDHNNNITTVHTFDWIQWCVEAFNSVDLLLFGCTNNLQSLEVPTLILKKERSSPRVKYDDAVQLGYYYKR